MTKEEILSKLEAIDKKCSHWKSSQDGSYEMALHNNGYFKLIQQLKQLSTPTTVNLI
jgi:hypothetical protein